MTLGFLKTSSFPENLFKAHHYSPYLNVTEGLNPNQAQNLPSKAAFVHIYSQHSILG